MKYRLITMTLLALSATAAAQTPQPFKLEVRPFVGAFVPTGQARDDFEKASMAGMQGAIEFSPSLHVLCSMFWTQTDAKLTGTTDPTTYVLQEHAQ